MTTRHGREDGTDAAAVSWGASAAAFITDEHGDVLLVNPAHTVYWTLPGGHVEDDELPDAACARELRETLGLDLRVGPLLVAAWLDAGGLMPRVHHVFDAGQVSHRQRSALTQATDGRAGCRFVPPERIDTSLVPPFTLPLWEAALTAHRDKRLVCLDLGT
ncbi:NUDIX hydrolase [Streptomyces lasiicapitis]|uniref:NUDIX hydrolase n=1 Tax=Streptomyces lasiicapitis TaxID=1923961 RepID=UPI0033208C43